MATSSAAPASLDTTLTDALRAGLAAYAENPTEPAVLRELAELRRLTAAHVAALPLNARDDAKLAPVREWLRLWAESGANDAPASSASLAEADQLPALGWPGLLGAMLLVPAWQWLAAPRFRDVPAWLRGDFARYVFQPVQGFCSAGDAERYAAHHLRRLEELVELTSGRIDADTISALKGYLSGANCIPLYFAAGSLRRHYELRARLLSLVFGAGKQPDLKPRPRAGRRLRVGFINRHFGSQTETYTTLPMFERLDPERFEVLVFAHHLGDSPLEKFVRDSVPAAQALPAGLKAQLELLRAAELDVAVFGTNVTAVVNEVTQLALHRIAPLQIVNNSSCTTTGLTEIDLYVSGTQTESAEAPMHFTERLGLVSGPAHAFNYRIDAQPATTAWTRAQLGIPNDAVLFVSAANYFKIIPEMRTAWARLLAAVPGSRLLLHPFNPNWSSRYPIKRFCAEFDRVLQEHGVATDRLVVSTAKFPSRTDVKALLALGDIYLDTFPFGGVNSLVDPLENGTPVVAWEGDTFRSRMGAALLRSLGLDELVAPDAGTYHALCVRLATDTAWRDSLRTHIAARMDRMPVFLDTLAASDGFGALLEKSYDDLVRVGREAFRRETAPIIAAETSSIDFRREHGRWLLAQGRFDLAVTYFLSGVEQDEHDASLWHGAAAAFHGAGRRDEAVQALQACLRVDAHSLDGWLLLGELALTSQHADLLGEAINALRQLAPGDARVSELERRAAAAALIAPPVSTTPRVLIYTDDPQHGGVAQYNHSLMEGLVAAGYHVSCAQTRCESPLVQRQRELGVEHHWIAYDTKTDFARALHDTAGAQQIFTAARPDLVIFSDCCPLSNFAARDAAIAAGLPYVVVVGFVGAYLADRFQQMLGRLATQYAHARSVVAVSQENLALLRQRFGLATDAGQVIHYGRPEKFFAPRDPAVRARLRAELNLPDDAVLCLTTARLAQAKGFLYQLGAAKRLAALPGGSRIHFAWCGDGEQRGELERAIGTLGFKDRIHLLGHRWDVSDWYDAADIFVLPSELEGMPLAIMEAMGKGLPVAATAVSGIPEELGDTGQLLPAPTQNRAALVEQLAQTLSRWASDATLREQVGTAGRERARALFRESLMIERTVGLVRTQLELSAKPLAAASA